MTFSHCGKGRPAMKNQKGRLRSRGGHKKGEFHAATNYARETGVPPWTKTGGRIAGDK